MKRTKKYLEAAKIVDSTKYYGINEAIETLKKVSYSKFDGSVDITLILNLKDKQKNESVKGTLTLPNSLGKAPRVIVIAESSDVEKAKKAGADEAGLDDLIKKIEGGWTEFDVLIATPEVMVKIAKLGRYIGKQGLMPNPKNGTVTKEVDKAVESFKAGKTTYKMNDGGVFQFKVAKASMNEEQIKENIVAFMKAVNSEVKKFGDNVFKSFTMSPSMGPGIKVDLNSLKDLA